MRVTTGARLPHALPQRGFALIALLAVLATGMLYFLVGQLDAGAMQRRQDEATTRALAQAKEALIAYAVSVDLSGSGRPGDLPCPDRHDLSDALVGTPSTPCSGNTMSRLPWKKLGLPDLRDASGERLWYAVSSNFKNSPRAGTLNSDTTGTISVRDASGQLTYDSSVAPSTGVAAVIIAPGPPITRQDGLQQDRSGTAINNPRHYLDNIAAEDNADFDEVVNKTNGFFSGPVRNANGEIVANDRLIVITRDEIMAAVEKRVAAEVMKCLTDYASSAANGGRYPWAAAVGGYALGQYGDTSNTTFGRVPDLMCSTAGDGVNLPCNAPPDGTNPAMSPVWTTSCMVTNSWFKDNWREQVFYAVADAYKPDKPETGAPLCGTGTCLSVDGVSGKQVTVIVAGRKVGAQDRIDKSAPTQYLEDINRFGATGYVTKSAVPPFNDRVLYR